MPMYIPSHIFDVDRATAERLVSRVVFKRRIKALCLWGAIGWSIGMFYAAML